MMKHLTNNGNLPKTKILLDLGGVLLNYDLEKIVSGFSKHAKTSLEEIRQTVLGNLKADFDSGRLNVSEFRKKVNKRLGISLALDTFSCIWSDIFSRNTPLLDFILGRFEKKHLFVLSNTDPLHVAWIMQNFPELNGFGGYAYSYELGMLKPEPEFFVAATKRMRLRVEDCIFIDDNIRNARGARSAGIAAIEYTNGDQCKRQILTMTGGG